MKVTDVDKRGRADEALARSLLYRVLAQIFAYPLPDRVATLNEEDLPLAAACAPSLPTEVQEAVEALAEAFGSKDAPGLESAYTALFQHVHSVDAPLYETDMTTPGDVFRQSQELADLGGFYRAFGMEPDAERPDALSVELEFLHLLTYKIGWAIVQGEGSGHAICDKAQRAFLSDHVLRWVPDVARRIEVLGGTGPYGRAATLLRMFLDDESTRLGVEPAKGSRSIPLTILGTAEESESVSFCEEEE